MTGALVRTACEMCCALVPSVSYTVWATASYGVKAVDFAMGVHGAVACASGMVAIAAAPVYTAHGARGIFFLCAGVGGV